jgi:hypothetical protein
MAFSVTTQLRDPDRGSRPVQPSDDVRRGALAHLYERRSAVNNLIGALERYQQEQTPLEREANRP